MGFSFELDSEVGRLVDKSKLNPNSDFDAELAPHIYSMIEKRVRDGHPYEPPTSRFALKASINKFLGKIC